MPQIPSRLDRAVPQSRRGVTRVDTSQVANAAQDVAQIEGQGQRNLAQGVSNLAGSMQRAQNALDETEYTEARSKFLQAKIAEDGAYDKDADWGTYETRYTGNLGKVRSELTGKIKNPKLRRQFEAETELDLARGTQAIKSKAFERETKDGIDTLDLTISENISAALATKDRSASEAILKATQARIDSAVTAGYISEPGAKLLKRKTAQAYAQQRYDLMPPEEALAELVPGAAPLTTQNGKPAISQVPLTDSASEAAIAAQPDAEILRRIAQLESSGRADPPVPSSGARGLFQFVPKTAKQYGLKDPTDPKASTEAAQRLLNDNRIALRGALGREPSPSELYLAHQQGAGGAAALLANPDQPAIVALTAVYGNADKAKAAILQNGGTAGMTSRQFANLWKNRFNGGNGEPIGMVLSGEIPPGGWDFTQKNGTAADVLDPSVRGELIAKYAKKMTEESEAARKAVAVEIALGEADQRNTAYQTGEVDANYVAKAMAVDPVKGVQLQRELTDLAQQGNDQRFIATSTPADDEAMLAGAALAANEVGPGSAQAAERYGQLVDAVNRKRKALAEDPAAYAIEYDPVAKDAGAALQDVDPSTPEGKIELRMAYEAILQAQERLGVSNPRALPTAAAKSMVAAIQEGKTPKDQLATFLSFADTGDDEMSRLVIADLAAEKGLPPGADLIADVAIDGKDMKLAEKLWSELAAETKGVELGTAGKTAVNDGIMADGTLGAVIAAQAEQTGDSMGGMAQMQPLTIAIEQIAKARIALGMDPTEAAETAISDLTGHMQVISDPSFAEVYFPKSVDRDALESGLYALRERAASTFPQDPYSHATANDIRNGAVWVNDGGGLSLIVPGSGRALMTVKYDDVLKAAGETSTTPLSGYEDAVKQIQDAPLP